jgi:2-polyprenyl-3-methyl-5-hydroxy-6-metoxy-1,4-benzoquinol methylase
MEQQHQTLDYFRRSATDWREKAEGRKRSVNLIKQRNDFVLSVADRTKAQCALDVGCGTGELACSLHARGISAIGVDFAKEMVDLAQELSTQQKLNVEFIHASIFEYRPRVLFDLISANGFIEYISEEQLHRFLELCRTWLKPGGSIVLGSRNRLFNLISFNSYTSDELKLGTILPLVRESILISESVTVLECIAKLTGGQQKLQSFVEHPITGIGVSTRHQYTPGELVNKLRTAGYTTQEFAPAHYHGVSPVIGKSNPDLHIAISEAAQEQADFRMVPFSSSFMIHAVAA